MVCELCFLLREHHMVTILTHMYFVSALAKNHTGFNKESIKLCWKLIDAIFRELCLLLLHDHHMVIILTFLLRMCTFVSALAKKHTCCFYK